MTLRSLLDPPSKPSLIHSFFHSPTVTMNLNFRLGLGGVEWRNERMRNEKREGGSFLSFLPLSHAPWPFNPCAGPGPPAPSPSSLPFPQPLTFSVTKPAICTVFEICIAELAAVGRDGGRGVGAHLPPPALFDFAFLHLAFQRRWSINRLWPAMPQLSFVFEHVCTWAGRRGLDK